MLSNQTFDLHSAQQRRKNSMPMVFDVPKVPNLPATKLTNIVPHRRGLSLDQRTNAQQSKTLSPQDEDTVSLTHGFKIYQQHLLREAQQQKQQARPGQQTSTQPFLNEDSSRQLLPKSCPEYDFNLSNQTRLVKQPTSLSNEIAKIPPGNVINTTNVRQSFDGTKFAGYFESFDFGPQKRIGNYQEENKANTIRMSNSRGISSTNSANPAGQEVPRRPSTPQNQTDTCYFPITPAATPFSKVKKEHNTPRNHKAESSLIAEDPNLTIRPSHAIKRGVPCQDIFYSKADLSSAAEILSPPNSGHLLPMSSTDLPEFPSLEFAMTPTETYRSPHCSPGSNALSSAISSFQSSPEIAHLSLLSDHDKGSFSIANVGKMPNLLTAESIMDLGAPPSPTKSISPSRSQSVSDIDLNAIVEDTGITSEEIAIFIGGPDPLDGKWTCMYEDCGRSFGRKENIKSHVQTHLGDRQYRCIHCGNTFVRQHDLKRHAKIHSGIKPYPCDCGRSFARHDALTRHRQRNTCIGGFEGMSKKPTKRGRPKKVRPSADERIQKASKTRQRVLEKAYPSSMSGSSECSFPSPPQTFENLPDLPSSQMMSRESTSTYFSSSSELDLLASPTPFLDFDFSPDVGKGSTDAPSFSSSFEEFGSYDDMDKMLLEFSKTGTEEKEPSFTLRMAEDALFGGQSWAEDFKERGGCFDDLY